MNQFEETSKELALELDEITELAADQSEQIKEVEALARDNSLSRCIWHNGCYYCKVNKKWKLIKCVA